ncbi:MAG: hypothetical protein AAFV80_08805 [Bacteroidota bacterium]
MDTPQHYCILLLWFLCACMPKPSEPETINPEDVPVPIKLEDRCPKGYLDWNCKVTPPIDSVAILKALKTKEFSQVNEKYWLEDLNHLKPDLDTLVLSFGAFACSCPQWVDNNWVVNRFDPLVKGFYDQFPDRDTASLDGERDYVDPYYDAYFLEQADPEVSIPDRISIPGNQFLFIGRIYKKRGHPRDYQPFGPPLPEGRVFRFYSYEILKPYQVYGPEVYEDCHRGLDGQVQCPRLRLTVRDK